MTRVPREVEAELQHLRRALSAIRVTLRVGTSDRSFPVVGEALAADAASVKGDDESVDARATAGFQWLRRERRMLVQADCAVDDPPAFPGFIERYGARSQMVAPLLEGDAIVAVVSVHSDVSPRIWTTAERSLLQSTVKRIQALL